MRLFPHGLALLGAGVVAGLLIGRATAPPSSPEARAAPPASGEVAQLQEALRAREEELRAEKAPASVPPAPAPSVAEKIEALRKRFPDVLKNHPRAETLALVAELNALGPEAYPALAELVAKIRIDGYGGHEWVAWDVLDPGFLRVMLSGGLATEEDVRRWAPSGKFSQDWEVKDRAGEIRQMAAWRLAELEHDKAFDEIQKAIADPAIFMQQRCYMLLALSRADRRKAPAVLMEIAQGSAPEKLRATALEQLSTYGETEHAYLRPDIHLPDLLESLDAMASHDLSADLRRQANVVRLQLSPPVPGFLITRVDIVLNARSELEPGDIILSTDGRPVWSLDDLDGNSSARNIEVLRRGTRISLPVASACVDLLSGSFVRPVKE